MKLIYQKKQLKPAQVNLLAKLDSFGVTMSDKSEKEIRRNQISGVSAELEPLAVALFDFIMESYGNYLRSQGQFTYRGQKFPVSVWDRTRYLFLELWPDEYYKLID